jgi:hypothetical protein
MQIRLGWIRIENKIFQWYHVPETEEIQIQNGSNERLFKLKITDAIKDKRLREEYIKSKIHAYLNGETGNSYSIVYD